MEIYVVRHGQTDWNINHIIQGQTDIPLNEEGIKQAHESAHKLQNIKFDICYCSNLVRAKQTANIIIQDKCPIIYNDIFNERNMGQLQGTKFNSYLDVAKYWDYQLNCQDCGVECVQDLLQRGQKALDFIDKSKKRVLIVSHGALIKAINYCIIGYDNSSSFDDFHLLNCDYKKYIL